MSTLQEFKQDIEIGDSIIGIEYKEAIFDADINDFISEYTIKNINPKLAKLRLVIKKTSKGIYVKNIDGDISYIEYPKAKDFVYNDNIFTITYPLLSQITYQIIK